LYEIGFEKRILAPLVTYATILQMNFL
jgi:hypothetical protein